jgi:predicted dehydrogenase
VAGIALNRPTALRAGIIGSGYMGRLHLRAYEHAGIQVLAAADPSEAALQSVPEGVERCLDYRKLLEADIDLVSICLPTALHCPVALDALAAGKHVFVEKPIAASSADADLMMAAARRADRQLFVGMTHRFYPEVLGGKSVVDSGGIGEVVFIRDCIFEYFGLVNAPSWYLRRDLAGGGTVLSSGVHLVDRVLWFMGETPLSVAGCMSSTMFGTEVEDTADMTLGFPSGRFANIAFALLPVPHPLVCDLEIIGTRGSVVVHTWNGYEHRSAAGVQSHSTYTDESHRDKVLAAVRAEVNEFRSAIVEGRDPRPTAEESTRSVRIIEAFYRAVQTGRGENPDLKIL